MLLGVYTQIVHGLCSGSNILAKEQVNKNILYTLRCTCMYKYIKKFSMRKLCMVYRI